jgi:hypothetical protein
MLSLIIAKPISAVQILILAEAETQPHDRRAVLRGHDVA